MATPGNQSSSVIEELKALESRVIKRIRELEPLEAELTELRSTAQRLGLDVTTEDAPTPKRQRTRRGTASKRPKRRAGQSRPRSSRAEDVIKAVSEQPGITVSGVGEMLKVNATGLYPVVKKLQNDGRLRKDGASLHPVETPAA